MNTASHIQETAALQRKKENLLKKQLDPSIISRLDKDGNGVDRLEFVVGMLTALDLVQPADVQTFLNKFHELDADNSGHLDSKDLRRMQDQLKQQTQPQASEKGTAGAAGAGQKGKALKTTEPGQQLAIISSHARYLLATSGMMLLQVFWATVFGFAMLLAGLLGMVAVRTVLEPFN